MTERSIILDNSGGWRISVFYDVRPDDLGDVAAALIDAGETPLKAGKAIRALQRPNSGYTYTNYAGRKTVAVIGRATTQAQFANTLAHELKHIVEHISTFYNVSPKSEAAGYLQGYVGSRMITDAHEKNLI